MSKFEYNLDEVKDKLVFLQSGEKDNGAFYHYFRNHEDKLKEILDKKLKVRGLFFSGLKNTIFSKANVSENEFRTAISDLTIYEIMRDITGEYGSGSAHLLFFALCVNFAATRNRAIASITSISTLNQIAYDMQNTPYGLDYTQYIVNSEDKNNEFKNEFIAFTIDNKDFATRFIVSLPIIKMPMGFFRFELNHAGTLKLDSDPDGGDIIIPAYMWHIFINEGISQKNRAVFNSLEARWLKDIVKLDHDNMEILLSQGGFYRAFNFLNVYSFEVDKDTGTLNVYSNEEPTSEGLPEDSDVFKWEKHGNKYYLKSGKFYLVSIYTNNVYILTR